MLKRILESLGALLEDTPVFDRLIDQMKVWGDTQQDARHNLVSVLTAVVVSFERAHAIVLIELSRLTSVTSPEQYKKVLCEDLERDKFYALFQSNEICEHVHQLHADLLSGFGDIKEAIVLGAAKKLAHALGAFEDGELSLAQRYQEYLNRTLFSAFSVKTEEDLKDAIRRIIDEQANLSAELADLTKLKQRIYQIALYG